MAGVKRKPKNIKTKKQREEKYNAENEIIIGVTTKPKEVRVDKKRSTRTKPANNKKTANAIIHPFFILYQSFFYI